MRVLMVEHAVGDSVGVTLDLIAAGHEVVRCQPVGGEVSPCLWGSGHPCPVADGVDVAVDVAGGAYELGLREMGAVCALRWTVPLVTTGRAGHPLHDRGLAVGEPDVAAVIGDQGPYPAEEGSPRVGS